MRLPSPLDLAVEAGLGKKAEDVVVLDVRDACAFADYFLLASGTNQRQIVAIADAMLETLRGAGLRPGHVEGYPAREWILMDFGAFIIHVFTPRMRGFYDLERLWGQAKRLEIGQ